MKTVNLYKVNYRVDIKTKDTEIKNLEQFTYLVGNENVEKRIMRDWNQENVKLVPDSVSIELFMKDIYYDEENIDGYGSLFKVTSLDGQKKYFSIISYSASYVYKYIRDNHLLENLNEWTDPYYVSYENTHITL